MGSVSTELVTAIFAGLVSLLTAIAGVLAQRAKGNGVKRSELRDLKEFNLAAVKWIYKLELAISMSGMELPSGKPRELTDNGDDDSTKSIPRAT